MRFCSEKRAPELSPERVTRRAMASHKGFQRRGLRAAARAAFSAVVTEDRCALMRTTVHRPRFSVPLFPDF